MSDKILDAFFKAYADTEEQVSFKMADEIPAVEILPNISTGSYLLDDALACGGYPIGRVIQLYGAPGSGKTLMSMIAIKNAQKQDSSAKQMFINSEGTFDRKWAQQLGLDLSKIIIVDEERAVNGRLCFEMLLGTPKEDAKHKLNGKSKRGFLDLITDKEVNCNMIILDSLGSIIPPQEDVSEVGKANISPLPRFLSTVLKKLSLEVKKSNVVFIIINHQRANMDPYGQDHTYAGGNSYSHFLSANIYFKAIQAKDAAILDDNEDRIGHTIRAKIEKNKMGPWPRTCEFKVKFDEGIVGLHEELANLALKAGVVEHPNNVSYLFEGETYRGWDKFCEAIKDNSELSNKLIEGIAAKKLAPKADAPVIEAPAEEMEEVKTKKEKKAKKD